MSIVENLGFTENPFAQYVAENEPNIDQYFVKAPYFKAIHQRSEKSQSFILFGARGAGKSATRLAIHKESWNAISKGQARPLTVTLDDFSSILRNGLEKITTKDYLLEVGYLVSEAVLVWLSALEDDTRAQVIENLLEDEKRTAITVIEKFYLARPESTRQITARQASRLLDQAWTSKTAIWANKKWGAITALVASIATALTKKATDSDIDYSQPLLELLKSDAQDETKFSRGLLEHFVDFAKSFGFTGVTILIDKADETEATSNSATASAKLLHPLLVNVQLLEIEDLGWICFLWDSLYKDYNGEKLPIRLDKIANAHISWPKQNLQEIITQRLNFFSQGKIKRIDEIFSTDYSTALQLTEEILETCMNSPRELIRIFDTVLRENEEQEPGALKIKAQHTAVALDKYCAEAIKRIFEKTQIQQLSKLGKPVFINKDIQKTFRINIQSAKSRIDSWIDSGLATLSGSRPAEGGGGGKPANEYSVIDIRVRRLIEKKISLGAEYTALDDD